MGSMGLSIRMGLTRNLPTIPGSRSRHWLGTVARSFGGWRSSAPASRLIRFPPTAANSSSRNGRFARVGGSAGPPPKARGRGFVGAQVPEPAPVAGRCKAGIIAEENPTQMLGEQQQCRNQTPATKPAYTSPRIRPSSSARLPPVSEHQSPKLRHPPINKPATPAFTKMASEHASASASIKTAAAPVEGVFLNPSSSQASTKAPSDFASIQVQRPAQFLSRPVKNTGTATGTSTPIQSKRTMVSITPHSVNRTALHPHGVLPREHTDIEEELHARANIDYDRVAIIQHPSVAALYEDALVYETGTAITSTGALTAYSGAKTGRSPGDKRIVKEPTSEGEIWWGPVNKPMTPEVWLINRERAVDYLNTRNRIYVVDGFAGWDKRYQIKVRVICARAYHALFMRNMLIRPAPEELVHFEPDYTIYNAGSFPANRYTSSMTSSTSVAINFAEKEMVILGTEYAGEMKKGVFTVLFYEMPIKHNVLTLHSSANQGKNGDVSVFFGLSGTGKTTLSADSNRALIGDDEHCWTDTGIFNIEGGCYAKCVGLSAEKEPDIYNAIRFGSVLENVVFNPENRVVDYEDITLTENTRCAYPIEFIPNVKLPCISDGHPTNLILLTCDASGILPPVSKLTPETVSYHFISGYTSKMSGTEEGVTDPTATFSACFGQPFLALHPMRYAKMLAEKIQQHGANAWLINTGWSGQSQATGGKRCPLKYTRAILDSIHSGELAKVEYENYPIFNLAIPKSCPNVPSAILNPKSVWSGSEENYLAEAKKLAICFQENFQKYQDGVTKEVIAAGPQI